jgi:hypothetical protein
VQRDRIGSWVLRDSAERPLRRATYKGDEFPPPHSALKPRTAAYHIVNGKLVRQATSAVGERAHQPLRIVSPNAHGLAARRLDLDPFTRGDQVCPGSRGMLDADAVPPW